VIDLDANLPAELVPLSWLIGVWEGPGVVNYKVGDDTREHRFGQRVSFSHDGLPFLNYSSFTWLDDDQNTPLTAETGYWRLARPAEPGDRGPAMLPGVGVQPFTTPRSVETLRNNDDAFDIEVGIQHPTGVSELYLGQVKGPRIDLATDVVMRSANAKEHSASTRMYGLVQQRLFWAWDIAALGQELRTHASAELTRVS
jgi:hypothetical protein